MKTLLKIAAALFIFLLFFTLFAHAGPDQDALASLRDNLTLALKMGDAAKAASLFTIDATSMPQGFPTNVGREAIEKFYSDGFIIVTLRDVEIHSKDHHLDDPNTLRDHGIYTSTWVPKDGSAPYTVIGRYLIIAKRQADGHWLISWEMHTIEARVPAGQL